MLKMYKVIWNFFKWWYLLLLILRIKLKLLTCLVAHKYLYICIIFCEETVIMNEWIKTYKNRYLWNIKTILTLVMFDSRTMKPFPKEYILYFLKVLPIQMILVDISIWFVVDKNVCKNKQIIH